MALQLFLFSFICRHWCPHAVQLSQTCGIVVEQLMAYYLNSYGSLLFDAQSDSWFTSSVKGCQHVAWASSSVSNWNIRLTYCCSSSVIMLSWLQCGEVQIFGNAHEEIKGRPNSRVLTIIISEILLSYRFLSKNVTIIIHKTRTLFCKHCFPRLWAWVLSRLKYKMHLKMWDFWFLTNFLQILRLASMFCCGEYGLVPSEEEAL